MKIDSAFLADTATIREGTLGVLGGLLNQFGRPSYPATLGCVLVIVLSGDLSETRGVVETTVHVAYARVGEKVKAFEAEIALKAEIVGERFTYLPLILDLANAEIPSAGDYVLQVEVGDQTKVLRFYADHT